MPATVIYTIAALCGVLIADMLIMRRFLLAVGLILLVAYAVTTSPFITWIGA